MFAGLRRVNVGEHISYRAGTLAHSEHWNKYEPEADYRSVREAADAAAVVVDRASGLRKTSARVGHLADATVATVKTTASCLSDSLADNVERREILVRLYHTCVR